LGFENYPNKSAYNLCRPVIVKHHLSFICWHKLRSISVIKTPSLVLERDGVLEPSGAVTYVLP